MSSTVTVASASDLYAALASATGGSRIVLESGFYGDVRLIDYQFSSTVTIVSADSADTAVFNTIYMNGCTNITIDRVEVDFVPDVDTVVWDSALRIDSSSNITVSNSVIEGGLAAAGDSPDIPLGTQGANGIEGYPIGNGIFLFQAKDIEITNTEISMFHKGIGFDWVDGLNFSDNYIHDVRTSHFSGGFLENAEINDNHFSTSNPWNFGGLGDHGDIIHIFHRFGDTGSMDNITISGNFFEQGDGEALLGIYLDNNEYGQGFTNVTISDNILHNGNFQGIRFERVIGAVIENNTFLPTNDVEGDAPGMVLTDGTRDLLVQNNILGPITGASYTGSTSSTMTFVDNVFIQSHDPMGENYIGNLFSRGLIADGDANDFYVIPDSAADGVGASATQLWGSHSTGFGVFNATGSEGAAANTVTFDALSVFGVGGEVNLSGATVEWTFGDGQTGTGESITHTYDAGGHYDVKATVRLSDGTVITSEKALVVASPEALSLDFENGIADQSDFINDTMVTGIAEIVDTDFGSALRLGADSYIEYDRSWEMVNNSGFTVSVDFQKDAGAASPEGTLVSFIGGFGISTYEGKIYASVDTTGSPAQYLGAVDPSIEDGGWHNVTLTFSSDTGIATLFIDGKEVDSKVGLEGLQSATAYQDFHVGGNNWSSSFTGLIDNVEFLRYAQTAEEVNNAYLGLEPPAVDDQPAPVEEPAPVEDQTPVEEPVTPEEPTVPEESVVETGTSQDDVTTDGSGSTPVIGDRTFNDLASPTESSSEDSSISLFRQKLLARFGASRDGDNTTDAPSGDDSNLLNSFASLRTNFGHTESDAASIETTDSGDNPFLSLFTLRSRLRAEEQLTDEEDDTDTDFAGVGAF
ncbi:LamG-like jellyroll fold domain-containing protein [Ovoidimarina sediminis]|uniref:LamG-like jellyroll fold domain-containing protein n=1 Tax=Ovoidimarina sediminis TaxID=3079856 RepID=UPI00290E8E7E|nr:LamG-like jellyroll fold domain-containing protein [Rhodophyticola sp. MJ-SS7]MDU8943279.1 LamG-like jellyroll fold domain-containing protein [Rhodophyticola sp. MJ-SS7]